MKGRRGVMVVGLVATAWALLVVWWPAGESVALDSLLPTGRSTCTMDPAWYGTATAVARPTAAATATATATATPLVSPLLVPRWWRVLPTTCQGGQCQGPISPGALR